VEEANEPFDLATGPMLRAKALRVGEEEQVVTFTVHHIVSDGWSMGVLIREVSVLYEAYCRGEASPLGELAAQYADYAVWQREWLRGAALEEQVEYWKEGVGGGGGGGVGAADCRAGRRGGDAQGRGRGDRAQ